MLDEIAQVGIVVLGTVSILLVAKKNKWGFVVGLLSQPFWLYTAYIHNQWGSFLVSIIYTFSWAYGIHEWFYKKGRSRHI